MAQKPNFAQKWRSYSKSNISRFRPNFGQP